ncbi:hypothetical protein Caci_4847 [Catenulispora acidiphila DSM 44928]|uniref:Uncharacterized protein n=1 Tax=Catenulispora acidiphila (strain DSM 44928 / JCM 14897 / NBRC 102108 / NRRL B-24433 / ID139908) TaxID=479433 RepID=C7Q1H9_CATAD|nr:hypothetical protein Caci_4847 [Catenulispora acidiphila DSM 44928]
MYRLTEVSWASKTGGSGRRRLRVVSAEDVENVEY